MRYKKRVCGSIDFLARLLEFVSRVENDRREQQIEEQGMSKCLKRNVSVLSNLSTTSRCFKGFPSVEIPFRSNAKNSPAFP